MNKSARPERRPTGRRSEIIDLCVYAHFYQPLREDPFTEEVPREPGAEPFANYNQKIDSECYRPNAALGNFRRISFDIGPTLTGWLESNDGETLRKITESDSWHVREFEYGNALAQPFHHTILPLATRRDKELQVDWGIADFVHRFGRHPQGLWLPETAADMETLEVLAERGIRYTVLAPWQAQRGGREPLDPATISLPGGRTITVFFFDSRLSNAVSFNPKATRSASRFVASSLPEFGRNLILIAGDGELYGHHQQGREHFLHDLLSEDVARGKYRICTLGEYLARADTAGRHLRTGGIREKTSWSCHHGVDRWSVGCSCTAGDSAWKPTLRRALNDLAKGIDQFSMEATEGLLDDFWAAARDYIGVVLRKDRSEQMLAAHSGRNLSAGQTSRVLDLLKSQYYRQAMFTSCAFFWDDLGRLEPKNVIGYAARAIDLVGGREGAVLEEDFVSKLAETSSQSTGENGAEIYADWRRRRPGLAA